MEKDNKKKKKLYIMGGGVAAVLIIAIILAISLGSCGGQKYDKYFSQAQEAILSGDNVKALELLEKAVAAKPTEEAYLLMAELYVGQGNTNMAIQVLYLGYSKTGSDAVNKMLEELKNGEKGSSGQNSDVGSIIIAGNEIALDTQSIVLSQMGLKNNDISTLIGLTQLESLSLSDNEISDIFILASLENLTFLQLSRNSISDLMPLKDLSKLKTLYIDENPIEDFTPLYKLTSLRTLSMKGIGIGQTQLDELQDALPNCHIYSDEPGEEVVDITLGGMTFKSDVTELDLSGRGISDISELSKCKKLITLNLAGNRISDISPLVDLQELSRLNISGNSVADINPLMTLTGIAFLNAQDNVITNIAVVGYLPALKELDIGQNEISGGFAALEKLSALEKLELSGTGLTDAALEHLYGLTSLKTLTIEENEALTGNKVDELQEKLPSCEITAGDLLYTVKLGKHEYKSDVTSINELSAGLTNIEGLEKFAELKTLVLTNNSISSIAPLKELTALETLDLYSNSVSDLSPMKEHSALKNMDLMRNSISDLSPLSSCTGLEELHLGYNSISNISALSHCTKLSTLEMENNQISDISSLSSLTHLGYLNLDDNEISDLTALYSLKKLESLYIRGNNVTTQQVEALKERLPECNIVSDYDVELARAAMSAESAE